MEQADRLAKALRALLRDEAGKSPVLMEFLVELANTILEEAERQGVKARPPAPTEASAKKPVANAPPAPQAQPAPDEGGKQPLRRSVPLRIGDVSIPVEVAGSEADLRAAEASHASARIEPPASQGEPEIDLNMIVERARLKAASCRLFIERRQAEGDADRERPILEVMKGMIDRAQNELTHCFLWVFFRERTQPDDATLLVIASCYDALADAARLCASVTDPRARCDEREQHAALSLLAEASSALRVALRDTWLVQADRDQDETHLWLRTETWRRSIFVERHMTLDDPADPARADAIRKEAVDLLEAFENRRRNERRIEEVFNKARYHARQLADEPGHEHHARTINTCLDELYVKGVRPGDDRLDPLRLLVPPDGFPAAVPASEAARALLSKPKPARQDEPRPAPAPRAWSARVLEARELLQGGSLVIIGGEPRADAIERITEAFALESVEWVPLSEHGTGAPMQAPIARPSTRAVIVLIKLTGHLHAEEARVYARQAGKPCIHLPAGYNPEQIAEHLLNQAAERLN